MCSNSVIVVPSSSFTVLSKMQSLLLPQTASLLLSSITNSRFPLPRRRPHTGLTHKDHPKYTSNFSWMGSMGKNNNNNDVASTTTISVNHHQPTSVPVRVAHDLLQAGHHYLDVRTPGEFSTGHAVGAINIPYMFSVGSGMTKNPNFVDQVLTHFRKDDEIIVGCQSGKRSLMAAIDLLSAGFTGVTDIAGGFAAWSRNELPIDS